MTKLNDTIRSEIISILIDEAPCREDINMQRFLARGITEAEIGVIDSAMQLLRESPYMTDRDFERLGYSYTCIQRILGGLSHFKSLLNREYQ